MKTPQQTYDRRQPMPVARAESTAGGPSRAVRPRSRSISLTSVLFLIAAIIGGASVFAWDRSGSRDRTEALVKAIDERDEALATTATLTARVARLRDELVQAQARVTDLAEEVAAAQAELLTVAGPPLDDGRYFGALIALGATQKPPRLVIDVQQWFTDDEAIAAAIEDGVIEPGEIVPNGYYIRNENPRWRTIEIDPAASVSLTVYPHGEVDDPEIVSLERFADLSLEWSEYWIVVEDDMIVAVVQQFIP